MAEHITEEEQIEAIKRWWKENGTSLVFGVVLAVGGWFGFQYWTSQQQVAKETASALYDQMMEVGVPNPGQQLSEQDTTTVNSIAEELKASYSDSLYAHNAAMLLAKIAVEQDQLQQAESELRWVLANKPSEAIAAVVNLRLATVLYAQEKYTEAQQLIATAPDDSFASAYAELRGDILIAQNLAAEAKLEYETALDKLLQSQNSRRDMIQMKLDDIAANLPGGDEPEQEDDQAASAGDTESETELNNETNQNLAADSGAGQAE